MNNRRNKHLDVEDVKFRDIPVTTKDYIFDKDAFIKMVMKNQRQYDLELKEYYANSIVMKAWKWLWIGLYVVCALCGILYILEI